MLTTSRRPTLSNDVGESLSPLIENDLNDDVTLFQREIGSVPESKLGKCVSDFSGSSESNLTKTNAVTIVLSGCACTCNVACSCSTPARYAATHSLQPHVPVNSSSSKQSLHTGSDHGSTLKNTTGVLKNPPRRAFFAIGGMSDSASVLRGETSELELIEEELEANSCGNNHQQNIPRFHSAPKNVSDGTVNLVDLPKPASPNSCSSLESVDNTKKHIYNQVFVELYDLDLQKKREWTETARWIKYEEDVEGADHHWGQPHVAFLSFHALLSLRKFIRTGMILLDSKAKTFADVCDQVVNAMIYDGITCKRKDIMRILSMKQAHPLSRRMTRLSLAGSFFERRSETNLAATGAVDSARLRIDVLKREHSFQTSNNRAQPTIAEVDEVESSAVLKQQSFPNLPTEPATSPQESPRLNSGTRTSATHFVSDSLGRINTHPSELHKGEFILKKLPAGTETVQIFVGIIENLTKAHFVMLRLREPITTPEILDGEIPLRFAIVILGPYQPDVSYHEVGRSIATLMANEEFNAIAYEANLREELIFGVDGFLDDSVVIPPGEVDNKRLLSGDEIRKALKKRRKRKKTAEEESSSPRKVVVPKNGTIPKTCPGKEKRRRFFSGMFHDFRKRFPYYWSDYRDALNFQCLTSVVFMFFASFAPAITFGGLLGKYTNEAIGIVETLMAQCVCGVIWGVFAAQPLMIMSATGPVLVFEVSLYTFCSNLGIDFLTVRLYSGLWVLLIAAVTVAVDGSRMLCYVTRFTEDIFAALISIIFIAESLRFLQQTFNSNPVGNFAFYQYRRQECEADAISGDNSHGSMNCGGEPNTALLSTVIMISTFALAYGLRQLRQSYYLGRTLRRAIGDFGVLISIAVVACLAHLLLPDPYLQRLEVPDNFNFTNVEARGHGLFVSAYLPLNQLWVIMMALAAALLVFILLFVETEITELLLSRKDRGLVKGSGLHWDLLLMGACTLLCSIFGLPWMCAAAVQSLAHCGSLTVHKKTAPGERPGVDYVIEQRVTTIGVSLLMGLFAFAGSYLRLPLASLFGVFLYLGIMNLSGVQLVQRIVLFFIPEKYFPDTPYAESVNIWRMHLYTAIQIMCLVVIYVVKYFKQTALAFPFILMLFIILRQFVLNKIFDEKDLKALDGDDKSDDEDDWLEKDFFEDAPLPV